MNNNGSLACKSGLPFWSMKGYKELCQKQCNETNVSHLCTGLVWSQDHTVWADARCLREGIHALQTPIPCLLTLMKTVLDNYPRQKPFMENEVQPTQRECLV